MNDLYFNQVVLKYLLSKTYEVKKKSYNFGYLSTDDWLKGNDRNDLKILFFNDIFILPADSKNVNILQCRHFHHIQITLKWQKKSAQLLVMALQQAINWVTRPIFSVSQ